MSAAAKKPARRTFVALLAAGLCLAPWSARPDSILLGSECLETIPGVTFFDFSLPARVAHVPFKGKPIAPLNLGTTDTIVQRRDDATPPLGGSATVPIEIVAISLVSVNPMTISRTPYDVAVWLNPNQASTGTMTIRYQGIDNGTAASEVTFDSFFDVFFTAGFTKVGNPFPMTFSIPGHARMGACGVPWSHEVRFPGALLVTGPAGDQDANNHTPRPPTFDDLHIQQAVHVKLFGDAGQNGVTPAQPIPHNGTVAEPSTLLLIGRATT